MLKIKCDINQQDLKFVDHHFVKSEIFSLTWSCGSRQLNNLTVKGLKCWNTFAETMETNLKPPQTVINVSVSSSRFIWISMLWVYGNYKYINSFSAWTVFIRQNLVSTDVRFRHIKTGPALNRFKGAILFILRVWYSSEILRQFFFRILFRVTHIANNLSNYHDYQRRYFLKMISIIR